MSGPLEGTRVLDLSGELGLPCSKFLADGGADVIKIEPPGGDGTRARPPFAGDVAHPERSLYFLHNNANKRGVTLDLETSAGQDLFRKLATSADVVVETFTPGVMDGWGLGYETLSALNPGIVVASVTLFGQSGPYRDYRGGELVAFALGGLMALSGEPGGPPCIAPGELSSGVASMHAALAIQVALFHRARTGRGQHIDVSVAEAAAHAGSYVVPLYSYDKKKPVRVSHLGHCPELHHDLYPCQDGWVRFFILDTRHWQAFVQWTGSPELAEPAFEDRHVRGQRMDEISPHIEEFCRHHTKRELYLEGQARHLAVTPVNTPAEFADSEQTAARGFLEEIEHPVVGKYRQIGAMHKYSETPTRVRRPAPLLGQHNDEVFRDLEQVPLPLQRERLGEGIMPLEGVRVIELCTGAAGPTVAKCLGEYGAEIIKIESRQRPDGHRGGGNKARWNKSPDFVKLHRNKKSVTINMQTERGKELVKDLIRVSGIVVENYSLGVMERWGLAYEQLREIKPDIVLIRLKGLGTTGPHTEHITYGPNLLALMGMTHLWNDAAALTPTAEARTQHPDFMSGIAGAAAVMSALLYRQRTGKGQCIDSAQVEAGASLLGPYYLDYLINGRNPMPAGNTRAGAAPYGAYPCAGEDKWCVIAVEGQREWERFRGAIGNPSWAQDERFASLAGREHHWRELDRLVGKWTRGRKADEVMELLQAAGIAAAPVQDVEDQLYRNPQFAARGLFVTMDEPEMGPIITEGPPLTMSETPPGVFGRAPLIGEHTEAVLREVLKLSENETEALTEQGVLD